MFLLLLFPTCYINRYKTVFVKIDEQRAAENEEIERQSLMKIQEVISQEQEIIEKQKQKEAEDERLARCLQVCLD